MVKTKLIAPIYHLGFPFAHKQTQPSRCQQAVCFVAVYTYSYSARGIQRPLASTTYQFIIHNTYIPFHYIDVCYMSTLHHQPRLIFTDLLYKYYPANYFLLLSLFLRHRPFSQARPTSRSVALYLLRAVRFVYIFSLLFFLISSLYFVSAVFVLFAWSFCLPATFNEKYCHGIPEYECFYWRMTKVFDESH